MMLSEMDSDVCFKLGKKGVRMMAQHRHSEIRDDISRVSLDPIPATPEPSYSSDPNDWGPKDGPHPSD